MTSWLRPLLVSSLLLLPAASHASDRDFQRIVGRLSEHYQKKPMRGMGFLSFLARCFSPSGVHNLKMAIFEDVQAEQKPLDGDFEDFLKRTVGSGFHPFVTVRSNRDGERVYIYAKDVGERMELLIVCAQPAEAVVMKMRLDPEAMAKWMNEPGVMAVGSSRGTVSR